jgi:ABC-type lipoprotein export system ATPase subunit
LSEPIFILEGLSLSYNGKELVLKIPELQLHSGKLYFFIGASGTGKSTLLETLGLMNYPVLPDKGIIKYKTKAGDYRTLDTLWKGSDRERSQFRMENFAFIFQSTNLMPHFTAGENMCYSLLLEGSSWEQAKAKVMDLLPLLNLPDTIFEQKIQHLSGGQRQRLAFVRAFVSSFEVLFGDEPTGNLDPNTAEKLMGVLKGFLVEHQKTGIIVSHDIHLATRFADQIFFLKKETNGTAALNTYQSYIRNNEQWWYQNKRVELDLVNELKSYL